MLKKVNGLNTIYKKGNNLKRKIKKENRKQKKGECFMITIKTAKKVTKPGEIVLFSPASASFDMFKNFEERGNKFKQIVNKL